MIFQKVLGRFFREPLALFLFDGFGALLSAFLYFVVLANFENVFGMPQRELYLLTFLACAYAVFSFSCFLRKLKNWQVFMKTIAVANLMHCVLTLSLCIYHYQIITTWGILYFAGELIVVTALALFELRIASDSRFR